MTQAGSSCLQDLVRQWDGAEAELSALQGEAVLRIASAIKVFEDKLQRCVNPCIEHPEPLHESLGIMNQLYPQSTP